MLPVAARIAALAWIASCAPAPSSSSIATAETDTISAVLSFNDFSAVPVASFAIHDQKFALLIRNGVPSSLALVEHEVFQANLAGEQAAAGFDYDYTQLYRIRPKLRIGSHEYDTYVAARPEQWLSVCNGDKRLNEPETNDRVGLIQKRIEQLNVQDVCDLFRRNKQLPRAQLDQLSHARRVPRRFNSRFSLFSLYQVDVLACDGQYSVPSEFSSRLRDVRGLTTSLTHNYHEGFLVDKYGFDEKGAEWQIPGGKGSVKISHDTAVDKTPVAVRIRFQNLGKKSLAIDAAYSETELAEIESWLDVGSNRISSLSSQRKERFDIPGFQNVDMYLLLDANDDKTKRAALPIIHGKPEDTWSYWFRLEQPYRTVKPPTPWWEQLPCFAER